MSLLTLGDIGLDGFEVPARVTLGGSQSLTVHKMLGGTRVIDVLGRDDAAITWSGVLSGRNAGDRGRRLDAMRASGELQTLSWDAFSYSVFIATLKLEFCNPWWIPYDISCVVQQDLAQQNTIYEPDASAAIAADLASAMQLLTSDLAGSLATASNTLRAGVAGRAQAGAILAGTQQSLSQMIQQAGAGLASSNLLDSIAAAGSLANFCRASGYVGRTLANVDEAVF